MSVCSHIQLKPVNSHTFRCCLTLIQTPISSSLSVCPAAPLIWILEWKIFFFYLIWKIFHNEICSTKENCPWLLRKACFMIASSKCGCQAETGFLSLMVFTAGEDLKSELLFYTVPRAAGRISPLPTLSLDWILQNQRLMKRRIRFLGADMDVLPGLRSTISSRASYKKKWWADGIPSRNQHASSLCGMAINACWFKFPSQWQW